ncbi:MAG TPA: hypothetical protein VKE74_09650 [Gemmataceae bacterium]|nr:hypothetical protein [Gemmataceae bacterium]
MARRLGVGLAVALGVSGCATAPPLDNPLAVRQPAEGIENPVLVSPGVPTAVSYKEVFEKCIDVLDDYFEIREANPYAGRIVTKPRIAPGYEQVWKGGNPDPRERLLATLQTIRQTATVEIRTGERGGYLVLVVVKKELEDLSRPIHARVGNAVFHDMPTVDRTVEVVGPTTSAERNWFEVGRDCAFEQQILRRIRECR